MNTDGISPEAGIDIEPNYDYELIGDLVFYKPETKNNTGKGITINLNNIEDTGQEVNIVIYKHTDEGSIVNAGCSDIPAGIRGQCVYIFPTWKESANSAFAGRKH